MCSRGAGNEVTSEEGVEEVVDIATLTEGRPLNGYEIVRAVRNISREKETLKTALRTTRIKVQAGASSQICIFPHETQTYCSQHM